MDSIPLVKDFMSTSLVTFAPDMDVYEAIDILIQNKISGAPVIKDGKLCGILSERDCLRVTANGSFYDTSGGKVRDFMSKVIHNVDPEMDIFEVSHRFLQYNYRRFPVLDGDLLVGQISRRDVIHVIHNEAAKEIRELETDGYLTDEMKAVLDHPGTAG